MRLRPFSLPESYPLERMARSMPERLKSLDEARRKQIVIWSKDMIKRAYKGGRYPKDKERQGQYVAGFIRQL